MALALNIRIPAVEVAEIFRIRVRSTLDFVIDVLIDFLLPHSPSE
jgi:hypothetical protein